MLKQEMLNTKNVYILDCYTDLFVWVGKKSTRLVRAAALKLSSELFAMLIRPEFAMIHRVSEGTESQVFKSRFVGWDDVIGVDFTRTAASVARTGADLNKWARQQETKVDLSALFTNRQPSMNSEEAARLAEEWNEDLEKMEAFVLEKKKREFSTLETVMSSYADTGCQLILTRRILTVRRMQKISSVLYTSGREGTVPTWGGSHLHSHFKKNLKACLVRSWKL